MLPRALVLVLLLVFLPNAWASEWPGWRGGILEARSASPQGPLDLSEKAVVWKTPLLGVGHSSPIVTQDSVYVTSSWNAEPNPRMVVVFQCLLWLILSVVVIPTNTFLLRRYVPGEGALLGVIGTGVLCVALCGLVFFGEGLLNFNRAVERGWIAACLCGTLCLTLASLYAQNARRGALALLAFSGVLALTIPDRAHTVAAEPFSDVSKLIYTVIALPLLAGMARRWPRTALLLVALVPVGLFRLTALNQDSLHRTISVGAPYSVHLPIWLPLVPLLVLVPSLWVRQKRGESLSGNGSIVVSGVAAVSLGLLGGAEQLLARVPYLTYLLGEVSFTPLLGTRAFALFVFLAVAVPLALRSRISAFPRVVRVAALLLLVLYFVYANALPRVPHLERGVLCLDRKSGTLRWVCGGVVAPSFIQHSDNSEATPTPVTDGERIYAYFGTPGLLCVDRAGHRLWVNRQLPTKTREGVASSPLLCQGKVILLSESDLGGYLAAFDGKTGALLWKIVRSQANHPFAGNCRTPTVVTIAGQEVIVVWGNQDVSGYDPATGRQLWTHPLKEARKDDNPVASATTDGKALYLLWPASSMCLDLERLPSADHFVVWRQDLGKGDEGAQCATPVVVKGLVFAVSDNGSAYCLDARTGKELWRKDLEQQHYASVFAVGERIYFFGTQGRTTVVAAEPMWHLLAQQNLDGQLFATGAPVDGQLFVRSKTHLYCLGGAK